MTDSWSSCNSRVCARCEFGGVDQNAFWHRLQFARVREMRGFASPEGRICCNSRVCVRCEWRGGRMTIKRYYLVESPEDCPCWSDCYTTPEGVHICRKAHVKCEDSNKFPMLCPLKRVMEWPQNGIVYLVSIYIKIKSVNHVSIVLNQMVGCQQVEPHCINGLNTCLIY